MFLTKYIFAESYFLEIIYSENYVSWECDKYV